MANRKEVWTVVPRGEGRKDFWLRIGTAFENRDGSWSIMLDALPVNGKLIVREPREESSDTPRRSREPSPHERAKADGYQRSIDDDIPF